MYKIQCVVVLNSQEEITPARDPIGSNLFNWLKVGPGVVNDVSHNTYFIRKMQLSDNSRDN